MQSLFTRCFESRQLHYAYLLLGILQLLFVCMFFLVVRLSVKASQDLLRRRTVFHIAIAVLIGWLLSPLLFLLLELALVCHGIDMPLPAWFKSLNMNLSTFYPVQLLAETFLNAVPQAIVQTK